MDTMAWLMILVGGLIINGIRKGRVLELPTDLRDFFIGAITGDVTALKEVNARTGTGITAPTVTLDSVEYGTGSGTLVQEMQRLAREAGNNYQWGGESIGEGGYDCSGLVWAALKSLGYYDGPRFTSRTFPAVASDFAVRTTSPGVGDIVSWSGHMGVVSGQGRYYSALSEKSGIKESAISSHKGTPTYWRLKTTAGSSAHVATSSVPTWGQKAV
ncbi:MAG TPA: NlpC/P60 family protein [Candidatus Paceibacterota bacterium]|nr:NlpC/P60 family protein [Candidatus Paceibacterota bacterium]